jgi:Uma2 family endonuclease
VPAALLSGEIVALGVSADEFMEKYAADHHEWVQGAVIKMSPATSVHYELVIYLTVLLKTYFEVNPIGIVRGEPFVMRLDEIPSRREPDIQVILNDNLGKLTDTAMIGPADICIEVVSEESITRDYGSKFKEYQQAGVREYWIIDPLRSTCDFNRLDDTQHYARVLEDGDGIYKTPMLPKFALHVPTLWQKQLPGIATIVESVMAMLTD